jgi:hypothetical protein
MKRGSRPAWLQQHAALTALLAAFRDCSEISSLSVIDCAFSVNVVSGAAQNKKPAFRVSGGGLF